VSEPTRIAVAVVEHKGRFLVGQRPLNVPLAGYWEFPGGKIEPGESPEEAAVRECREEAGIDVDVVETYPVHEQQYEHGSVRLHFLACQPVGTLSTPSVPFRWVARRELAELQFPAGNRQLIESLLDKGK